jgi:hypothetical protein
MGFEPTASSLGRRLSIDNKDHSFLSVLFWRYKISSFHSEHWENVNGGVSPPAFRSVFESTALRRGIFA